MDNSVHKKLIFSLLLAVITSSLSAQNSFWKALKPDEVNLQYAGSIGFLSAGAGYHIMKEKGAISFHVGYLPESLGGELTVISAKFHYKPWKIDVNDRILIYPFNPVIFPSYTLGQNFDFKFEAPQYRKGYYFWSSALRLHAGASAELKVLNKPDAKLKSFSIYAETNTNDLYLITWFKNKSVVPFYNILKLGYGVKVGF